MRSVVGHSVVLMAIVWTTGCYFEVSTNSKTDSARATPDGLAREVERAFAAKVRKATLSVVCPTGLTGQQGRQLVCTGTTSDGYALEIAVLERGEGAFRWDVVKSVPVASAPSQTDPDTRVTTVAGPSTRTHKTTQVDPTSGKRCISHENGYICIED